MIPETSDFDENDAVASHPSGSDPMAIAENMDYLVGTAWVLVYGLDHRQIKFKRQETHATVRAMIHREIARRKGLNVRGTVLSAYVPDTVVSRFVAVMRHETGARGQVLGLLFAAYQTPGNTKALSDALVHLENMEREAAEHAAP